ncbi:MAG: HAD family phosphatase, partial [Bryobacteraceae bacterium]|nr:HAD family phosphatase [Bryobacteraceae bacterium]
GTLVSSNVVSQYLWFARHHPNANSTWRLARALFRAPRWLALELRSRRCFNEAFFLEYAGLSLDWMTANARRMNEAVLRPATFPGARALVQRNRAEGFRTVLLTGSLDFAIQPLLDDLGFDEAVANRLEFRNGIATGALIEPILAGPEKVDAIRALCAREGADPRECRAYSDSMSDVPMLEAVGHPYATNPVKKLRALAEARRWPILDLK